MADSYPCTYRSCSETGLAITAASCATLRPLFRSWFATSAFNKSGVTETAVSNNHRRLPSSRPDLTKIYQGGQSGYQVHVQGRSERDTLEDTPRSLEMHGIAKGGILVEQCDSASVESATPSHSSTAKIVNRYGE